MTTFAVLSSLFDYFGWAAPVIGLFVFSHFVSLRRGRSTGRGRILSGAAIFSLSFLFSAWFLLNPGQFDLPFRIALRVASLFGIVLIVGGGMKADAETKFVRVNLRPWLLGFVAAAAVLTLASSLLHRESAAGTVEVLLYNAEASLLLSLYIGTGLFIRRNTSPHRALSAYFPFAGAALVIVAPVAMTALLGSEMYAEGHTLIRFFLSIPSALAAVLYFRATAEFLKHRYPEIAKSLPDTPVSRYEHLLWKRFLVFIALSVLLLGIGGVMFFENVAANRRSIQDIYLGEQQRLAESVSANFQSLVEAIISDLGQLASRRSVQEMRRDSLRVLFDEAMIRWHRLATGFSRVDENGILRYTYPDDKSALGKDLKQQSHIQRLLAERDTVMSDPFQAVQGYRAIVIHVPVFRTPPGGGSPASFAGSVAVLLQPDGFSQTAFKNARYFSPNPLAAINERGQLIASSDSTEVGSRADVFLRSVFGESENPDSLRTVLPLLAHTTTTQFIPVRRDRLDFAPRFIVAVPVQIAGKLWGAIIIPVRGGDVLSRYNSVFTRQLVVLGVLLLILFALTTIIIVIYYGWSQFLKSELTHQLDVIRETENKYEDLVRHAVVGIYESTPDGRFLSVNPALVSMLGHSSGEEMLKLDIPQDVCLDPGEWELFKQAVESEDARGIRAHLKQRDGTVIFARLYGRTVHDTAGRVISYQGFVENVTEQQLARLRLEESERRYRGLFETNPAGLYVSTLDGQILQANESFAHILGCESAAEVKTLSAETFYGKPEGREEFLKKLDRDGEIRHLVQEVKRKDGATVHVLENAEYVTNPEDGTQLIRGALFDITELVDLQRHAEIHQRLTQGLNDILVAALEEKGLDTFLERSLQAIGARAGVDYACIARAQEGSEGRCFYTWTSASISGDREPCGCESAVRMVMDQVRNGEPFAALRDEAHVPEDLRGLLAERGLGAVLAFPLLVNQQFWGLIQFADRQRARRWEGDEVQLLRSIAQVISTVIAREREAEARRQSEDQQQKFLSAFDQLSESVVITDRDGIIQYVNLGFTQVTGYEKSEALGKTLNIVESGAHDREFYRNLWGTMTAGKTWRGRLQNRRKDGSLYCEDKVIAPVFDASGSITHFVDAGRDVTLQIDLENQLMQAQKMESIGLLASGVAHDFNNLLGGILGYASFMKTVLPPKDSIYRYVDTIERSATRAAELTSQLLAFARGGKYDVKPVNLNAIVGETLEIVSHSFDRSIEIESRLDAALPAIEADAAQLQQVIMNLCVNARDAMLSGGKLLIETEPFFVTEDFVRLHVEAHEGLYVRLSISDIGQGMDQKTLRKIFDPFFTTKEKGKGTGLGLATVYGIVKNHGGFIRVYSEVSKGTAFRIYFPAGEVAEQTTTKEEKAAAGSRGFELILVVDDEELIRDLVKDVLQTYGYRVLLAADGEEAVAMYRKHKDEIALVILDMVMPKLGGRETFLKLKEANPKVKALLSTGYSQNDRAQEILKSGVLGFLQKPYQAQELAAKVRTVLDATHY